MRTARQRTGQAAEDAVLAAAQQRGLRCLTRNYRSRGGELDLILTGADGLVIVEVRYRARSDYGSAAQTVTAGKQRRVIRAARAYLAAHRQHRKTPVRFDVVGVDAGGQLDWIENAFQAI